MLEKILISLAFALALCVSSRQCLHFFQLSGYRLNSQYLSVYRTKHCVVAVCISVMLAVALAFLPIILRYSTLSYALCLVPVLVFCCYSLLAKSKTKLVITKRIIRLSIVLCVLAFTACYFAPLSSYVFIAPLLCITLPFLLTLSNLILAPIQWLINRYYLSCAVKKLNHSHSTVIGITGSYGKTSVKSILTTLLGDCLATPLNYNTPLGIARFLNSADLNAPFVVLEMGARRKGDIDTLCKLYQPMHAIITGIAPCHIESFGSLDRLISTKQEILLNLPKQGTCIMPDSLRTSSFISKGVCNKVFIPFVNTATTDCIYINNIRCNSQGSTFVLNYGKQQYPCNTILLGEHNIHNIALACNMAHLLGVKIESMPPLIAKLQPTPHRMCLIKQAGFTILDDSYNANIDGVKALCNVLKLFDCNRIVITQGIVEQGKQQQKINTLVGQLLADCVDIVCLVGSNGTYIKQGLINSNFDTNCILTAPTIQQAVQQINNQLMGSLLVFQNDLPDNL